MPSVHSMYPQSIPDSVVSGVEHLIHAQELQQQRQTKMLENLSRRTEHEAEVRAGWQHKQEKEERRLRQVEADREQDRRVRSERNRRADQHRRERAEVAAMVQEENREVARGKVLSVVKRAKQFQLEREAQQVQAARRAQQVSARRTAAMRQSQAIEQQRRQHLERKQGLADELLRQKDELRQLEIQIKSEQEFLNEDRRARIRSRSNAERAAKVRYYSARTAEKDAAYRRKLADMEQMRQLRAEELQHRAEYVTLHAQQAAERDEAERAHLRMRLAEKAARSEALADQRRALAEEMARVRQQMLIQESTVRASLERLRVSGAAFALPAEVTRSLHTEVGPGAGGFMRHLVSMRTRTASSRSPERAAHHGASPTRVSHSSYPEGGGTPRGGTYYIDSSKRTRPASAPYSPAQGSDARFQDEEAGDEASALAWERRQAWEQQQGQAQAQRVRYTTAGPIAPSTARRREEELRQVLQDEIQSELKRGSALARVVDERERLRLTRIFAVERQMAKERILALSNAVGISVVVT